MIGADHPSDARAIERPVCRRSLGGKLQLANARILWLRGHPPGVSNCANGCPRLGIYAAGLTFSGWTCTETIAPRANHELGGARFAGPNLVNQALFGKHRRATCSADWPIF